MNIGYTIFANDKWKSLVEILIRHLLEVSKYNIELFMINCDYKYISDRVKTINVPEDSNIYNSIYFYKFHASIYSEFDFSLILDGDMIPNNNIDILLEENYNLYKDTTYPICAKHPHNPIYKIENIAKLLNFNICIDYKYASYFFSNKCKDFFIEGLNLSHNNIVKPLLVNHDETILNCLLNKNRCTNHLNYNYLPNYINYKYVLDDKLEQSPDYINSYKKFNCEIRPYLFHGCKNSDEALIISNEILKTK